MQALRRIKPDEPAPAVSDRTWPVAPKVALWPAGLSTAQSPERIRDVEGRSTQPPSVLGNTDQRNKGSPPVCQEARPGNSVAPFSASSRAEHARGIDLHARPHGRGDGDALDIGAFGARRLGFRDRVREGADVL